MPTLSKLFYQAVKNKTCADFLHPNVSCWQSAKDLSLGSLLGAMKFYFPGCFLPMLFKLEKWRDVQIWKDLLRQYFKCIAIGYFLTFGSINIFCIFYQIFKRYHFPTFVFLPSALGCSFCMFLPDKMLHIDSVGLQALLLESLVRSSSSLIMKFIRRSRSTATFLFMFINAAIMFGLSKIDYNRFWFTSMTGRKSKTSKEQDNLCNHSDTCLNFNLAIAKRSLGISVVLVSLKNIVPVVKHILQKQPLTAISLYFQHLNYGAMAFVVANPVVFNLILCAINRRPNNDILSTFKIPISGFLAGLSYYFCPNYLIFCFGIITAIELLWQSYMVSEVKKPKVVLQFNKLPFAVLLHMLTVGAAFQLRVVYPHITNKFIHTLMSYGTGGRMDRFTENYAGIMMGLQ